MRQANRREKRDSLLRGTNAVATQVSPVCPSSRRVGTRALSHNPCKSHAYDKGTQDGVMRGRGDPVLRLQRMLPCGRLAPIKSAQHQYVEASGHDSP